MALPDRKDRRTRGQRRHHVTLWGPGPTVPDGDGGYTQEPIPLSPPAWYCAIEPASVRELELLTVGTAVTTAAFLLEGDYHPGITTQTQIVTSTGRRFYVNGVIDPESRGIDTIAFCEERQP